MPVYIFQSEKNDNDVIEVVQTMNEDHSFVIKDGIKYNRIFTSPNHAIDTKYDVNNSKDFLKVTGGNKKGTVGDLWDRSREWSSKRAGISGQDEVKEKYYKNYSETRNGLEHADVKKRKLKEKLKNNQWFKLDN